MQAYNRQMVIIFIILVLLTLTQSSQLLTTTKLDNCTLPLIIPCPPPIYCNDSQTIIIEAGTTFQCQSTPLNVSANTIEVNGGIFTGVLNLNGNNIQVNGVTVYGNLTLIGNLSMVFTQTIQVSNFIVILTATFPSTTQIQIQNCKILTKKILMQSSSITILNSAIATGPNICLYQLMNLAQFMKINFKPLSSLLQEIYSSPITVVIYAENLLTVQASYIATSILAVLSNSSKFQNSKINTTASACFTNLGLGKGLEAQMASKEYCSSGGSSSGYGSLSNSNCSAVLQYFMFLSHSFPYLNKGPYLCTGSGGYGYREGLGSQGAGGGIIFMLASQEFYTLDSHFYADGGYVDGNFNVSAGSGGTLFLYTDLLSGNYSNFSAAGGASYNNNGSGAGGIVKVSYTSRNFSNQTSMWVNVSSGYQPIQSQTKVENNGIFYGTFCPPGQFAWYLTCHNCPYGTYNIMGGSSCQQCPVSESYLNNSNLSVTGITKITDCFSEKNPSFVQIWIEPISISWYYIIIYIGALIIFSIAGLLIKKYYKKKLTVMETQFFSLDDAKKDVEESRILTERLKLERNIKFQDLMYHIHRITLFGSNNPQCPWALPQLPPQQIKKYILRQGFIDFSLKFNKVGKWTKLQKLISNLSLLIYPWHWYYYDKIKKSKYKKLLQLLEQAKQFNLINNYDFEDKNMVTIKISKNTDYTICYLDFMVYDRADTKYFSLVSPFIISISGQGNFLRPFYLQDRDVFFNSLFYIINNAKQKIQQLQQDAKKQLFRNLFSQKKKQQNYNKLIDFLKNFNTISITLDLSAPLSTFIHTLINLIQYISNWNESYFKQLGIQLDLILMISKVKKGHVVSNQIHILTNKYPQLFKEFMNNNIPKMNRYQKFDLKLGLFVYNPDQQMKKIKNRKNTDGSGLKKNNWRASIIGPVDEDDVIQVPLVEDQPEVDDDNQNKRKFKLIQSVVRVFNLIRYFLMTHRKLQFDKDLMKFFIAVVILFQCLFSCVWSVKIQFPYIFANLFSPFIGILWMVSGSYGIGKLFLIFNSMSLLDEVVTLIVVLILSNHETARISICEAVTIFLKLLAIPLATKFLSVSRKLSTSKMFK